MYIVYVYLDMLINIFGVLIRGSIEPFSGDLWYMPIYYFVICSLNVVLIGY